MASSQLGQLYKELQQAFMSGNLQQTGVLLARLKVCPRPDQPLHAHSLYELRIVQIGLTEAGLLVPFGNPNPQDLVVARE